MRTLRVIIIAIAILFFHTALAACASVTLTFDPSLGATGYKIYWGTASQDYTRIADLGPEVLVTIDQLDFDTRYYFAATAYDANAESNYSNEVSWITSEVSDTIPPVVMITNPGQNAIVPRRSSITIQVHAFDNINVSSVTVFINDTYFCAPAKIDDFNYLCGWNVPAANNKSYTLYALARDPSGNSASSPAIHVTAQ